MDVLLSFTIVSVFLILGLVIREICPIFKKLFIPASVIGGVLLLIAGPQALNLVDVSAETKGYPNFLIIVILTCIVFGTSFGKSKVRSYLDFTAVNAAIYGLELIFGVLIGWGLTKVWTTLPPNWGLMSVYCFWGGHGAAASSAAAFTDAGYEDYNGIAMVCATVGLVVAMTVGMALVNWGIRKGFCQHVDVPAKLPKDFYGGILPADKRSAIGTEVTSSASINNLALQIGLVAACIFIGWGLKEVLGSYVHPIFLEIDELVNGIIGALILWPLMKATKTDGYVDKKTISSFSGLCMEYLIVAAVGNLRIETVTTFAMPIIIYCVLMTVLIIVITVGLSYCFHKDDWFEKMITNFGQCTGSTPTGLALLRCVDPNNLTSAADATGVSAALFMPVYVTMIAVGPAIAMGSNGTLSLIGIGLVIAGVGVGAGLLFFRRNK